jgi:hypothetical protein
MAFKYVDIVSIHRLMMIKEGFARGVLLLSLCAVSVDILCIGTIDLPTARMGACVVAIVCMQLSTYRDR